jgi:uncharacterized protein involved in exopolysaccharide biosynthesis
MTPRSAPEGGAQYQGRAAPPAEPVVHPSREDQGISLSEIASIGFRHKALIAGITLVIVLAVVLATAIPAREYTSLTTFVTQGTKQGNGALSSFAAQLGVAVPSGDATQSPAFYTYLLQSRPILLQALNAKYSVRIDGVETSQTLTELYHAKGATALKRQEGALGKLENASSASFSRETGLISFEVHTPWPGVSQQIAQNVINAVNKFNLRSRQTSASVERQFVESRLREVELELRTAENRLQEFKQTNREFGLGSELSLERDRLLRQVSLRQQVYTSLAQAYEQAKIDEVRDTPVITVVEAPRFPIAPDSRQMVRKALLAGILGLMVALLIALVSESSLAADFPRFWKARLSPLPTRESNRPW